MKRLLPVLCLVAMMGSLAPPEAVSAPLSCERLWYNRNAIYARKGYCFRTERELEVFGSKCFRPYGKLTNREQRQVNNIRRQERRQGCPA